jgi:hypothetical protein
VYVGNRIRPWYGKTTAPLHPAQIDFAPPIDYRSAVWTESVGLGGEIGPKITDPPNVRFLPLRLFPPISFHAVATIQLLREVTPSSGLRILIPARVLIDHAETKALLGLWPTESDPFTNRPQNGVFLNAQLNNSKAQPLCLVRKCQREHF